MLSLICAKKHRKVQNKYIIFLYISRIGQKLEIDSDHFKTTH